MGAERIRIDNLTIEVPSMPPEQARAVAQSVARELARDLPGGRHREFGAVTLRVQAPPGATPDQLVRQITDAIRGAVR